MCEYSDESKLPLRREESLFVETGWEFILCFDISSIKVTKVAPARFG